MRIIKILILHLFFALCPAFVWASTYTVTNTNDAGAGSLRQAIIDANVLISPDNIFFNIPTSDINYNSGTGVWTISPISDLPMLTGGFITIDATTQTTNQGDTNPLGPEIAIDGGNSLNYAFRLVTPSNVIRGFILAQFDYAIQIFGTPATGSVIDQNYIGTDYAGLTTAGNNYGIAVSGDASMVQITENVISGNIVAGIVASPATEITITGNKIGTDVSGLFPLPNPTGILFDNSSDNIIGGTSVSSRNIISGNTDSGILINGSGSFGNTVLGNYIGTDVTGTDTIPNGNGIMIISAPDNIIGGLTTASRNIISGNLGAGIVMNGTGTNNNEIIGNYIGTDVSGSLPLSNHYGVIIKADADKNTVGGNTSASRNVISANWEIGVYIEASDSNVVSGNFIGTDFTGTTKFINGDTLIQANGVEINTVSKYNLIGGSTPGERNIISGNRVYGAIYYGQVSYNNIAGNYIGTDVTGSFSIPNATGICLDDASNNNIMENNLLSGNISYGLFIVTTGSNANIFRGNLVGTNSAGTDTIPNDVGLLIGGGAKYNIIGGANTTDRNVFSGNRYGGIELTDNGTDYNEIIGNYIGTDISGNDSLPNLFGIGISNLVTKTTIENNIISSNTTFGLVLTDNTDSNLVIGNFIGIGADGLTDLGNGASGILLNAGAKNNFIGIVGNGNAIAFNDSAGIVLDNATTINNKISSNSIYDNDYLGIEIMPAGVNTNDVADADAGPNDLMNFPVILSTGYDPGTGLTFITGTIDSPNPENSEIEIFKSAPDLDFNHGEGKTYLGTSHPDASGNWTKIVSGIVTSDEITATAIDQNGNTSEFADNFTTVVGVPEYKQEILSAKLFPNPTNQTSTLYYSLPENSFVEIVIQNSAGKIVEKIYKDCQEAGTYNMDLDFQNSMVEQGLYFVIIRTENNTELVLKLVIIN